MTGFQIPPMTESATSTEQPVFPFADLARIPLLPFWIVYIKIVPTCHDKSWDRFEHNIEIYAGL
jgi:hypothetical protein